MLRWRSFGLRLGLVAAVAAAGIAGCATVLGIDSDRHLVAADSGGEVDAGPFANVPPNFTCLRNPSPPVPSGNLAISWFFDNAAEIPSTATGTDVGPPIVGLTVQPCTILDPFCAYPVTPEVTSDDAGLALITGIPPAFTGYYAIKAAGFGNNMLFRPPQYHDEHLDQALATTSLIAAGGAFVGVTQQPDRAFAVVASFDCGAGSTGSNPAGGITYQLTGSNADAGQTIIYLQKNTPTAGLTMTDSVSGTGIIFNIPVPPEDAGAGTLALTATFAATGETFQTAVALVRQNWTTYVDLKPYQAEWTTLDGGTGVPVVVDAGIDGGS